MKRQECLLKILLGYTVRHGYTNKPASIKESLLFTTLKVTTMYTLDDKEFAALIGKTVMITGSITGIGRATFHLVYSEWRHLIDTENHLEAVDQVY